MTTDQHAAAAAASGNTKPFFIGAGVHFEGTVRHAGKQEEAAVIEGEFSGDIEWNGTLHVPAGGKVLVASTLRCREMVIAGEIVGSSDDAVVETGVMRLSATARIEVATVNVAPGGLEQVRGAVVNGRLRMNAENAFASNASSDEQGLLSPPALLAPHLAVVSNARPFSSVTVPQPGAEDAAAGTVDAQGGEERPLGSTMAA